MFTKRTIFLLVAVVMIAAVGVFTASAQANTDDDSWPPFGGAGRGMMFQNRMLWDGEAAPAFTAIADALGIDTDTLISEIQSGKSLTQLAADKGVDLATVQTAAQTALQQHLAELVTAGTLTQAQADARLELIQAHWDDAPLFTGTFGGGMVMGMGRGGMWDNQYGMGRGGMWNDNTAPQSRMGRGR